MNRSIFLSREQGHWLEALEKENGFTALELLWGTAKAKVTIIGIPVIKLSAMDIPLRN